MLLCQAQRVAEPVMNCGGRAYYAAQNKYESAFERRHNPA
jgi:hypothetical protein